MADVLKGGQALALWPVPLLNGKNTALAWHATSTVDPDGSVQIEADFTGPNGAAGSTRPLPVVIDRNADGAAPGRSCPAHGEAPAHRTASPLCRSALRADKPLRTTPGLVQAAVEGTAPLGEDFRASFVGYFRLSESPADTFSEVVVVPGKYQRQLPAEVTVTWVVSFPASPVVTVLTVL